MGKLGRACGHYGLAQIEWQAAASLGFAPSGVHTKLMLSVLRHHRHRVAWLPLVLMLASGLSLFAQGCLAAASSASDRSTIFEFAW